MKTLCCLVIGIFVVFSSAVCEGRCRLQEKLFELTGELNMSGRPVMIKLYSCDGENWFNKPPVLIDVKPTYSNKHRYKKRNSEPLFEPQKYRRYSPDQW